MVGSDPMRERMRSARIFGYIPANGAGALARWIRREKVAKWLHCKRDIEIHYAGLNVAPLVRDIDLEDAVHAGEGDHHAAGTSDSAATQSGSRTAADDGQIDARAASLTMATTFSVVRGKTTTSGWRFIDSAIILVQLQIACCRENGITAQRCRRGLARVGGELACLTVILQQALHVLGHDRR